MASRACDDCGQQYDAKRATSRFCSDRCRKRAQRRPRPKPAAVVVELQAAKPKKAPEQKQSVDDVHSTASAVEAELREAGRLRTSAGQAALRLARMLDLEAETGSGMAALAKQLTAQMEVALAGVQVPDEVADMRRRRAKRGA